MNRITIAFDFVKDFPDEWLTEYSQSTAVVTINQTTFERLSPAQQNEVLLQRTEAILKRLRRPPAHDRVIQPDMYEGPFLTG
jgi:hypothetical protein